MGESVPSKSRTYNFGRSNLTLTFGSIIETDAEAIVSSDDASITMSGGVSRGIRLAGGEEIFRDAAKKVPAPVGDIIVTTAGSLPAKYVFHAITIGETQLSPAAILHRAVSKCFDLVDLLGLHSIAFPAIGAGLAGFAYDDVAVEMANVIAPRLLTLSKPIQCTIFLYDRFGRMQPDDFLKFFEEFDAQVPDTARLVATPTTPPPTASVPAQVPQKEKPERSQAAGRVSVFISYAHEDEKPYLQKLCEQLKALQRANLIEEWHDRDITAGSDWRGEIDDHLDSANLILLLISPAFINSDYCYDLELKKALERAEAGEAITIPIIVRPCVWSILPFAKLQVLPTDGKPCKSWRSMEEAFVTVAEGIRKVLATTKKD